MSGLGYAGSKGWTGAPLVYGTASQHTTSPPYVYSPPTGADLPSTSAIAALYPRVHRHLRRRNAPTFMMAESWSAHPPPSAAAFITANYHHGMALATPIPNCSYRNDLNDEAIRALSLYLDGPFTLVAAILALIGAHFALKFLGNAGLNRELTAALYTLCFCDAFLIFMVILYHSIEATGILVMGRNVMWNEQETVLYTHGIVSAATTASTLLVVFITFQRFLVVLWPLRYARVCENTKRPEIALRRASSSDGAVAVASFEAANSGVRTTGSPVGLAANATLLTKTISHKFFHPRKSSPTFTKRLRPYVFPIFVIIFSVALNITVFFEFQLVECFAFIQQRRSTHLAPTPLRQSQTYNMIRTAIMMTTQTIGPISTISLLTAITEYKVHASLKARRILFESQHRRRSVVMAEELRERLSRTVAIFIAVKFLILRSLPIFFDIYETFYGIDSFGIVLSILVRLSDFGVVLNAATNSLAYFGKTRWLEMRLRDRFIKKRQTPADTPRCCGEKSPMATHPKPSIEYDRSKKASTATLQNGQRSCVVSPPRSPSASTGTNATHSATSSVRRSRAAMVARANQRAAADDNRWLIDANADYASADQSTVAVNTNSTGHANNKLAALTTVDPDSHSRENCYGSAGYVFDDLTAAANDYTVVSAAAAYGNALPGYGARGWQQQYTSNGSYCGSGTSLNGCAAVTIPSPSNPPSSGRADDNPLLFPNSDHRQTPITI